MGMVVVLLVCMGVIVPTLVVVTNLVLGGLTAAALLATGLPVAGSRSCTSGSSARRPMPTSRTGCWPSRRRSITAPASLVVVPLNWVL